MCNVFVYSYVYICPVIQRSNLVRNYTMGKTREAPLNLSHFVTFWEPTFHKSTHFARQEGPQGLVLEEDAGTFWMRFVFLAWHGRDFGRGMRRRGVPQRFSTDTESGTMIVIGMLGMSGYDA